MSKPKRSGLGKGLDALFVDNNTGDDSIVTLPISEIEPNKDQPRRYFDESALAELADSIHQHGVIQPIVVKPLTSGTYQIIAGERRWRASRMAGLADVPVIIKDLSELEAMEISLIENLQRQDLNVIEEAQGYKVLMDHYGMTQEQVAARMGKSRPVVANALRLLNLPDKITEYLKKGELSTGHARALLSIEEDGLRIATADKIVKGGMTVREVEKLAKKEKAAHPKGEARVNTPAWGEESFFMEMQLALEQELGRKVRIEASNDRGTIELEFYSREDLGQIAQKLCQRAQQ